PRSAAGLGRGSIARPWEGGHRQRPGKARSAPVAVGCGIPLRPRSAAGVGRGSIARPKRWKAEMLYRQAGIFHTSYAADRSLFPIPFERRAVILLLLFALSAPWTLSSLALTSYVQPWLIWTSAVLGLNLILGWAGQFHFGF